MRVSTCFNNKYIGNDDLILFHVRSLNVSILHTGLTVVAWLLNIGPGGRSQKETVGAWKRVVPSVLLRGGSESSGYCPNRSRLGFCTQCLHNSVLRASDRRRKLATLKATVPELHTDVDLVDLEHICGIITEIRPKVVK